MHRQRSRIATALILILLGVWFLVIQISPAVREWTYNSVSWPLSVIGVGVVLLLVSLVTWTPGLLVPACVVGGIGGLLYWQNATGNWESWAYAWALIPGFVGVGVILSGLLEGKLRGALVGGGWLIMISLAVFGIFGSFLGGSAIISQYWPIVLIVFGLILLVGAFFRPRRSL